MLEHGEVGHEHINSYAELRYDPDITKVASVVMIEIERRAETLSLKKLSYQS
jgi:hypothetical protein